MKKSFPFVCIPATLLVILLGVCGMITIAVGCQTAAEPFALVWKQFIRLAVGLVLMWGTANIPFEKIKKSSPYLIGLSLALLYALLKYGTKINGMRGWFKYGEISFQPSEPGKVFFLLGLVLLLASRKAVNGSDIKKLLCCGAYTFVWLAALLLQPDMGTAAVYAATFVVILFLGNIRLRYILSLIIAGISVVTGFILTHPYAMRRISGFLNPESDPLGRNWHLNQLLRAVARGSWTGVKSTNAHWSKSYLPFSYNDSVFASVCESTGFFGAILIPTAFIVLYLVLTREAENRQLSCDRQLFVKGAAFMLVFQSFLHISVNLGLLPVTGITMLFVSYGGSSIMSGCLLLGMTFSALKKETGTI